MFDENFSMDIIEDADFAAYLEQYPDEACRTSLEIWREGYNTEN